MNSMDIQAGTNGQLADLGVKLIYAIKESAASIPVDDARRQN